MEHRMKPNILRKDAKRYLLGEFGTEIGIAEILQRNSQLCGDWAA